MSPIANMLVQIKNAQGRGLAEVALPFSKMKFAIAGILLKEGYLAGVDEQKKKGKKSELPYLHLKLKDNAINGVRLISKPSRRMYAHADELKKVKSGYGISVVSTPQGIMSGKMAHKAGVGGEVLFEIW